METLHLRRKIPLDPKYFNSNIKEHLYRKLNDSLKNKCTQTSGYVVSVDPDIKVSESTVNIHGQGLFEVSYSVQTLKPRKDQVLEGNVCMVFAQGVLVEIHGKMKVLIPPDRIGKYKFDEDEGTFNYKKKIIRESDTISVCIDMIKYENNNFNCIGFLVT
jgi:DNA-directed RNA polymerase subunit E'/Rpb7